MPETTRQEHLDWCKERALAYVDEGDLNQAFHSFVSDIRKHPGTADLMSLVRDLGMPLKMSGHLDTQKDMRGFIEGFN